MRQCWYCDSIRHSSWNCKKIYDGAKEVYVSYLKNGVVSDKVKKKWKSHVHNKKQLRAFIMNYKYILYDIINENDKLYHLDRDHSQYYELYNFIKNTCRYDYYYLIKNKSLTSLYDITNNIFNNIVFYVINKVNVKIECPICYDEYSCEDIKITSCNHIFCKYCINAHLKNYYNCPMCRKMFPVNEVLRLNSGCSITV